MLFPTSMLCLAGVVAVAIKLLPSRSKRLRTIAVRYGVEGRFRALLGDHPVGAVVCGRKLTAEEQVQMLEEAMRVAGKLEASLLLTQNEVDDDTPLFVDKGPIEKQPEGRRKEIRRGKRSSVVALVSAQLRCKFGRLRDTPADNRVLELEAYQLLAQHGVRLIDRPALVARVRGHYHLPSDEEVAVEAMTRDSAYRALQNATARRA